MNDCVDIVILFVDMNDPEWRIKYNNYVEIHEIPNKHINNDTRFRDYGSLKVVLRSIDLYASWVNNVFLVVQSESQVPIWINKKTVKIVLHEDFIPKEYLPTFNCNTIETHLHFIPGLSEKFIYFNDDMLLNSIVHPEDFFINNKCIHYINQLSSNRNLKNDIVKFYQKLRFSNVIELYKIGYNYLDSVFFNSHGPTPMLKSLCEDIYKRINITDYITTFRDSKNLTQELFTVYALIKRQLIIPINSRNTNFTANGDSNGQYTFTNHNDCKFNLFSDIFKTFCINDVFNNDLLYSNDFLYDEIEKLLFNRFPNKSKYEL